MAKKNAQPEPFSVLLEDGSELVVDNDFRRKELVVDDATGWVRSRSVYIDGRRYDHCSDAPNGRWIYRAD
jgi:hypothetical protein